MKTLAAAAFSFLILCGPALADSALPARPDSIAIRFALHDAATTRLFDVAVSPDRPCASLEEKLPDRQLEIRACASHDAHLDVDWFMRSPSGEYRSTSSLALAHGTTAEFGTANGPRLGVTVQ